MSEADDLFAGPDTPPEAEPVPGGRRRGKKRRGIPGCLAVLVALAIVLGGVYFVGSKAISVLKDQFSSAADFPGPGKGKVIFEVKSGDTIAIMGRGLKEKGIVESVDAFTEAASAEPKSTSIQAGFFQLKKEMKASDVIAVLVDPDNIVTTSVTIPEGLRVVDIVDILAAKTDFSKAEFEAVLAKPPPLGLPAYADGNPEGYLFPATYAFGPNEKPTDMLQDMVKRWEQAAEDVDLEGSADALGITPHELMTVASLVQAEGRGDYTPKIARVIYNRLETTGYPTFGKLQIDATVNFALNRELVAIPTEEDTKVDSPYNTYAVVRLPPGPIEAPGDEALQAAAHPADGNWLFYVTVNLKTGETKFTESYDEFLTFKQELRTYCETQSDRC